MPVDVNPPSYPAMNLCVDGVKVTVGSADVDELNQGSDTDSLGQAERRGRVKNKTPTHITAYRNAHCQNNKQGILRHSDEYCQKYHG